MQFLPDGTYDVIVVDAENTEDGDVTIELTITLGPFVGHVIPLRARHVDDRRANATPSDPLALLGVPGTLRVRDGQPSFRPETT
jgi:hypothetical protein